MTNDPGSALLIYDDLNNFINAYNSFSEQSDSLSVLQNEYLDKGSPGLKMFINKYGLTAEDLLTAINKYPENYSKLSKMPDALAAYSDSTVKAYSELKKYIPGIIYPPTYFLVGTNRGIASASEAGQLITVEKWNMPVKNKTTILVHELVHMQQAMTVGPEKYVALYGPEKNLLGLCVREGTAEFFASLVTDRITQEKAADYVIKNEKNIWERFSADMHGAETKDWMWGKTEDLEQPSHVGYALGCRIAEAYYNNASDKDKALQEILSVTDYPEYLTKSGYAEQFEN
jgi:hypothetical protein